MAGFDEIIRGTMRALGMTPPDPGYQLPAEPAPSDSPVPDSAYGPYAQQELRSAKPLAYSVPVGGKPNPVAAFITPSTGELTEKGQERADNPMMNFDTGGIGAIKMWHGSPHMFDAFDLSKMGSGEGSQVRGRGLYLAGTKAPAKRYMSVPGQTEPGHLYETNVDVEPHELLDWNKPLSEQAPHIQEFAQGHGFPDHLNMTGEDLYEELVGKYVDPNKPRYNQTGAMDQATRSMTDAGIPGITYNDPSGPGFRGDGRSYVIMKDKLINILSRTQK